MWVSDDNQATVGSLNDLVEPIDLHLRERSRVEYEVLFAFCVLDIAPKHVNWEAVLGEVVAPFNQHARRVLLPFTEMESQRIHTGHRREPTHDA